MREINLSRQLLNNLCYTGLALMLTLLAVNFVDWPLAVWVHQHKFDQFLVLNHFTQNSAMCVAVAGVLLVVFLPQRPSGVNRMFVFGCGSILLGVALLLKSWLKCILGRNWPLYCLKQWAIEASPFLDRFGLNLNLHSHWQGSMPSGHTTFITLLCLILIRIYPNLKIFLLSYVLLVCAALVCLNYHFLGDCLAGICLALVMHNFFLVAVWLKMRSSLVVLKTQPNNRKHHA